MPERIVEQIGSIPVPSIMEKTVPATSQAALDPGVLDGFQQALVSIGAADFNTLTKQQLDDIIKVILPYSKQFKSLLENAQKLHDLSKAKLGDLLRAQQAFTRPHKAARR